MHRDLGVSYKTAWFMCHRIREALRQGGLLPPMGGNSKKIVEADETFIGRKPDVVKKRGFAHKHAVLTLIDRTSGEARSFHIDQANAANIVPIVRANVAEERAGDATDEASYYGDLNRRITTAPSVRLTGRGSRARSTPTPSKGTSRSSNAR